MMNDFRWGPLASNNTQKMTQFNSSEESWEWLLDALEIERIKSTLSQFPVTDALEPIDFNGIECVKGFDVEMKKVDQAGSTINSDEEIDDDSSMSEAESSAAALTEIHASSSSLDVVNDLWRGSGDDLRYSPGYILPLILATLEAYLPCDDTMDNIEHAKPHVENSDEETTNDNEVLIIAQCRAFGGICRRLCDRGGIALSIASLSSRCPSLRKVAVSICGLFLKALQMQESHGIKSWRERPQLEMIMSSLQRGLAVRRALQIQKYDAQEGINFGGSHRKHNIPMLPAVSAVFLAKALLVLSRPADEMYCQMNRYFLRLNDYHGAFQDCFGLPSFLSLYCSSSDDLSRCRTERNWALLTLKDGAADEFCYRIISQHHVPELIMSSFDSLIDHPESKSELYLTIDVIETLLQSGGAHASDHLIKRQGLLSWLHGIVSWRSVSSTFPYVALRCRFLKLITAAVDSYRYNKKARVDEDNVDALTFYEKVPLANVVIQIFLDGAGTNQNNDDASLEFPSKLLGSTCNALWAIHLAGKGSEVTFPSEGLTTLHYATSVLKRYLCNTEMFVKVLASLCDLPLGAIDDDDHCAKQFCELALGFILEMSTQIPPDTIVLSLKRVNELVKIYPSLGDETKIMTQVVASRHVAVMAGGIDVWNEFLPSLSNVAGQSYG